MTTREITTEEAKSLSKQQRYVLRKRGIEIPLLPKRRGLKTPRPIEIRGKIAIVPLSAGYEAIVDADDADRIGQWCWSAKTGQNGVYAFRKNPEGGNIYLHKLVIDALPEVLVDHKNRNTLDCRKDNLRPAEWWQNIVNQKPSTRNTSGFRGISQHRNGRWRAGIKRGSENIHIGYFATAEEAASAYDKKATELFGEFAQLNFAKQKGCSYLRYVRHADVPKFEAAGWVVCADLGPVHGHWSCLMLWSGRGEP